jgi:hypothetical protein
MRRLRLTVFTGLGGDDQSGRILAGHGVERCSISGRLLANAA